MRKCFGSGLGGTDVDGDGEADGDLEGDGDADGDVDRDGDADGVVGSSVVGGVPPGPLREKSSAVYAGWPYRHALMRHHGLMHVVNTVARERHGAAITGVQIGPDRSRIDFRLAAFGREELPALEAAVNEVLGRGLAVTSAVIGEDEFRRRPELTRTLNVAPPVVDGRVRVVEIAGFDAQACGGTHVHSTGEIGRARKRRR